MMTNLMVMKGYLLIVLICISLITRAVGLLFIYMLAFNIQAYLRDIAGWVPDQYNKVNIAIKGVK